MKRIRSDDANRAAWTDTLFGTPDPWHKDLFDMVLPMNKTRVPQASALIEENLVKEGRSPHRRFECRRKRLFAGGKRRDGACQSRP